VSEVPSTIDEKIVGRRIGGVLPAVVALGASPSGDRPDTHGTGNGFRTRFVDDLEVLAANGVTDLRLGFDWSRLQPRAAMGVSLEGEWIEWYRDVMVAARRSGVDVWATLLESTVPRWFDDERGFSDARGAGRHWPRFVEGAAECFGDLVAGWFPIDDPLAVAARVEPHDPRRHGEVVDTVAVAWRDAWRILRGGPPVVASLGVRVIRPVDTSVPAAENARREDHLRWTTFQRGLRDGVLSIPGRADRVVDDLAGAADVIGVRIRVDLGDDRRIDDESLRRWQERASTMLHRTAEATPDRPLVVASFLATRRGVVETAADAATLTEAFVRASDVAVIDGIPIGCRYLSPAVAADATQASGLLDWDRSPTPAGLAWTGR